MPDCPKCGGDMGLWERGLICSSCFLTLTFLQAESLPGYDANEVFEYHVLYEELYGLNLLRPGLNAVKIEGEGVTIIRTNDFF